MARLRGKTKFVIAEENPNRGHFFAIWFTRSLWSGPLFRAGARAAVIRVRRLGSSPQLLQAGFLWGY